MAEEWQWMDGFLWHIGDPFSGGFTQCRVLDGNYYVLTEETGNYPTGTFLYEAIWTNIPTTITHFRVLFTGRHDLAAGHNATLTALNHATGQRDTIQSIPSSAGDNSYISSDLGPEYISGSGSVRLMIKHLDPGLNTHKLYIDQWILDDRSSAYVTAPTPVPDVPSGNYTPSTDVIVDVPVPDTSTDDVTVHYTTDGTSPTTNSPVYTKPIAVFNGTLSTITSSPGKSNSRVIANTYTTSAPSSWDDYRNLGAWEFTEQGNKWGYLNNPDWSSHPKTPAFLRSVGLANRLGLRSEGHLPCGHWHKVPNNTDSTATTITEISPIGELVAALEQRDTPYIYLYDIDLFSIVKIDTTDTTPVIVDMLVINDADYILDYNVGYGLFPGGQRGSYCMSKDFDKVWYLFRSLTTGDAKLVEINITSTAMVLTNSTIHIGLFNIVPSALYEQSLEQCLDACGNTQYAFFCTNLISGRILRFDSAHQLVDKNFNYASTGALDESIHSMTFNPNANELMWVYNRAVPFATVHYPVASVDFLVRRTQTETDGGVDSNGWQQFIRYDEKYNHNFRQRCFWPVNGVAYYYSGWDLNIGRAFIQDLQYMAQYLGGNSQYFYVLKQSSSAGQAKSLHRFTHQDSTLGGAVVQINTDVSSYLNRFRSTFFSNSIYNEATNKSYLISYDDVNEINYFASFNSSLNLIEDSQINSGLSINTDVPPLFQGQEVNKEPQVWKL